VAALPATLAKGCFFFFGHRCVRLALAVIVTEIRYGFPIQNALQGRDGRFRRSRDGRWKMPAPPMATFFVTAHGQFSDYQSADAYLAIAHDEIVCNIGTSSGDR